MKVKKNGVIVEEYQYDSNGNRTMGKTISGTYYGTYDNQDRLISYGENTYTYTANGELLTKTTQEGTTYYEYDELGNLLKVQKPDGTLIEYIVDGLGRRLGKKVNGQVVQKFIYEGQLTPVAELDGADQIKAIYVYGTKINVPDYVIKGGERYKIITDHLGSVRYVVRVSDGAIVQQMEYDSFGNVIYDTNPGFIPFGFAGGIYDPDTKLIRFGARDYDPEVGRWLSKDRFDFLLGSFNLYSYVLGDPVNYFDPFGLKECLSDVEWAIFKSFEAIAAAEIIAIGSKLAIAGAGIFALGPAGIFAGITTIISGAGIMAFGGYIAIDVLGFNEIFGIKPIFPPRCKDLEKKKQKDEKCSRSKGCTKNYCFD